MLSLDQSNKGNEMIYLNNAATSYPKPPEVVEAVHSYLQSPPTHSARTGLERETTDTIYQCRDNLAKLLGAPDPLRFVFTSGSTEALNIAIKGIGLEGYHVVTTSIEHNSVIRPLKTMEVEGKISLTFVDCNKTGYVEPEKIAEAIRSDTKAIVVNHCSNVLGTLLDLKAIGSIARDRGCYFIVDASQSTGSVPINLKELDIDLFAFTGHKSLFGLPGSGGLYIGERIEMKDLKPLKVGGTGVKSDVLVQPLEMPMYYEAGTPNLPGITALNAGVEFILKTGLDNIKQRKNSLVKKIIDQLADVPEVKIYNDPHWSSYSNFCFNIEGMVPEEVGYALDSSYDIVVRTGLHCAPLLLKPIGVYPWGTVRASPGYFTTDTEVDSFIIAIKEIIDIFVRKNVR